MGYVPVERGHVPYISLMTDRIARLDSRALIDITGPDARPFLHNLLTQDVETLSAGEVRFGALLSPPGRLLFDVFLWGEDNAVVLDVAAASRDALMARLSMYRLRAQVQITADERPVFASWPGVAEGFVADPRLTSLGGRALGERSATADEDAWDAHRLATGVPDPTHDGGHDVRYPIEANFDLLNGIDFRKGCFVGQETTSRMKRRGEIKKRMLPLAFDGPPPPEGTEVLNDELRAGEVLTGRDGGAIALMRLDRLEGPLTVEGRPTEVSMPEWLEG